jgi:hypothetical protein
VGARNQENFEEELTTERAADGTSVVAMQWSTHWQCWIPGNEGCGKAVSELLPKFLDDYHVDFVNLGMFQLKQDGELVDGLPPGVPDYYSPFDLQCSMDNIKILYNSSKWELMPIAGVDLAPSVGRDLTHENIEGKMYGCFNVNQGGKGDRVYGIFPFKLKTGPLKIIVVFSHFPHPPGGSSSSQLAATVDVSKILKEILGTKINKLKSASAATDLLDKVLIISDLNLDMPLAPKVVQFAAQKLDMLELFVNEPGMSSESAWEAMEIAGSPSLVSATDYELTCCSDKPKKMPNGAFFPPAAKSKFTFAFDRVLADFGTMKTVMPLEGEEVKAQYGTNTEECPMYVGAFHKPIIGEISVTLPLPDSPVMAVPPLTRAGGRSALGAVS